MTLDGCYVKLAASPGGDWRANTVAASRCLPKRAPPDHNNASDSIPPALFDDYWPNVPDFGVQRALTASVEANSEPAIRQLQPCVRPTRRS